jgi:hypothetical protein
MSATELKRSLELAGCPAANIPIIIDIAQPSATVPIDAVKLADELGDLHIQTRTLCLAKSHWAFLLWAAQCALGRADAGPVAKVRLLTAARCIEIQCGFTGEVARVTEQNWERLQIKPT